MILEYVHQKIGEEIQALAGCYSITDELRVKHNGREILCIVGYCNIDSSCCGNRSFRYAQVPGYLLKWKWKKDKSGRAISEVEPIDNMAARQHIATTLQDTHSIFKQNIEFW